MPYLGSLCLCLAATLTSGARYTPDWTSLDRRPLPAWYDEAKIGIFLHWGVFSVPSYQSEWFWSDWKAAKLPNVVDFMEKNYRPGFTYAEFAPEFGAQFYDPRQWADLFAAAGARYVVLTSKHHEGYTLWPSKVSWNWNALDVGPKRDLLGELAEAVRSKGSALRFGVYHSLLEWFNPLYLRDKANRWSTRDFVRGKTLAELYELVNRYKPEVVWSDGDWEAPDSYWNSTQFLAWLYNDSPVRDSVVVNDRWGIGVPCNHGDFYTCKDRFDPGVLVKHKWESCISLDTKSWGYRRDALIGDYLSIEELIEKVVKTVSCNGNILINVGPTKDGLIAPLFQERLAQLGSWLKVNGEGIYGSKPWAYQNDTQTPGVWYTSKGDVVYAFVLHWPAANHVTLHHVRLDQSRAEVVLLGYGRLEATLSPDAVTVTLPALAPDALPSMWAWTLRLTGLVSP